MNIFRVGFSADFLNGDGRLTFPDIGLGLLENVPGLAYDFMPACVSRESLTDAGRSCGVHGDALPAGIPGEAFPLSGDLGLTSNLAGEVSGAAGTGV